MLKRTSVDRGTFEFPSLPPATALYFAVLEQSGIMDSFRRCLRDAEAEKRARGEHVPIRNLTVPDAFKAITGSMFTNGQRYPLYEIQNFYSSTPTGCVFGKSVSRKTLSDTSLAGRMEDMMSLDVMRLHRDIAADLRGFFGLVSEDRFLDQTDIDFFGVDRKDATGTAAHAKLSSKCKSGRRDCLHKDISVMCDGYGISVYAQPFDGATSDTEMDIRAVESMIGTFNGSTVVSGDCKLCDFRILKRLDENGTCFVTKVPVKFSGNLRELVVESARSGLMDASPEYPGRLVYETHSAVSDSKGNVYGDLRLIAYVLPGGKKRAIKYLREQGMRKVSKELKKIWHRRFGSEEEARSAVERALAEADAPIYRSDTEYIIDPRHRNDGTGPGWMARTRAVLIDEDLIEEAAERYAIQVLITNAKLSDTDADMPLDGRTSDSIINRYLAQAVIEKRFRMQKTCHGVGHIFIHTPIRQDAMIQMDCMASSVHSAMDAKMKEGHVKGTRRITMEMLSDRLVGCRLAFNESEGRIFFSGDERSKTLFFRAVDLLEVDLRYVFPYA